MKKKGTKARPAKTGKAKSTKPVARKAPAKRRINTASRANLVVPGGGEYPPILPFMIAFCTKAEGKPVPDSAILKNLRYVRLIDLNAAINDTYHIPAHVARYPGNRPNFELSVRGAAVDVKIDLANKGVDVPLDFQ